MLAIFLDQENKELNKFIEVAIKTNNEIAQNLIIDMFVSSNNYNL